MTINNIDEMKEFKYTCDKCGSEVGKDDTLCSKCGADVSVINEIPNDTQPVIFVKKYSGVGGWLLVYILSYSVIRPILLLSSIDYPHLFTFFKSTRNIVNYSFEVIIIGLGMFSCFSLWKLKSYALKFTKYYLLSITILRIISIVVIPKTIKSANVFIPLLWLLYFNYSKRIKNTYFDKQQ